MKRLLVALLLCGALTNALTLSAQSSKSTTPSRFTISSGIGLFPTYYKANEGTGLLPLTFKAGFDVTKHFSVATFFGFSTSRAKPNIFSNDSDAYLINKTKVFGIRAEFSKDFSRRVQGYGGSMIGYHHTNIQEFNNRTKALVVRAEGTPTPFDPNAKNGKITYAAFMGASVKLAKKLSIYGELGYGVSIASLGVTIRI